MENLIHTDEVSADIQAQAEAKLAEQAAAKAAQEAIAAKPAAKRQTRTKPASEASKPAKQGKASEAKPASEVSKGKGRQTRKAPKKAINFIIYDYARPKAGHLLKAFTAAWLDSLGMLEGNAVPRATLVRIAGDTAIGYHTKNGNFERTESGLKITEKGKAFFAARYAESPADPQVMAAYQAIFATGEIDGVLVKAQAAVTKAA